MVLFHRRQARLEVLDVLNRGLQNNQLVQPRSTATVTAAAAAAALVVESLLLAGWHKLFQSLKLLVHFGPPPPLNLAVRRLARRLALLHQRVFLGGRIGTCLGFTCAGGRLALRRNVALTVVVVAFGFELELDSLGFGFLRG